MKSTEITFDEWRTAIEDVYQQHADEVPKDWMSLEAGKQIFNVTTTDGARRRFNFLVGAGKAEPKKFRVMVNGRLQPVTHYRLKKK